MTRHPRPPFQKGDPAAVELGRKGGMIGEANRQAKAAADPLTRGLLGELLTYSTSDWMTRLGLVGESWESWRVLGQVLDGVPHDADEMTIYTQLTGRTTTPTDL